MPSSWAACSGDRISIGTFYNNFLANNILIDKDVLRDYNTGDGGPIAGLTTGDRKTYKKIPGQMKGNTFGTSDFATSRRQTGSRF
jgi:hypothetical protein